MSALSELQQDYEAMTITAWEKSQDAGRLRAALEQIRELAAEADNARGALRTIYAVAAAALEGERR